MISGVESVTERFTPPHNAAQWQNAVVGGLSSPELRGEIGAGILGVHISTKAVFALA